MRTIVERTAGFILEEYDDGSSVLLNSNTGIVHVLNNTASMLYKLCAKRIDKELLFESFIEELDLNYTDITIEEIRDDFEVVMKVFISNGILEHKHEG